MNTKNSVKIHEFLKDYLPLIAIPITIYGAYKLFNRLIPGSHNLPKMEFKDKVVVITGASSGIGKALAYELFARGAKLILLARSVEKLSLISEELRLLYPNNKNYPAFHYFDINDPENGPWDQIPKIDILINNAGLSMRGSVADTPIEVHRQVMNVNFFGHVAVTRLLLPKISPDGCIVATSSVQGKVALPYRSSYSASKHALQAFFDSLRCEHKNLHVLVVSAGYINTGFGSRALDADGKPVGVEDQNQKQGYSPQYAAVQILNAIRDRKSDFIMAATDARFAILMKHFWPTLVNYLLYKRGTKDPWAQKKKD
ncbi:unnamed protein product [Caenorhabditis bovis]|uniref:Uncharacterized protein n=1 Tax=Caenorhabditis bovis TaxID=2654633 RepID=A0A8S1EIQ8_9PELO|nr:unnamed protein product [Caenorhabditis bovis]